MASRTQVMANYTDAIASLPQEAFLGSLLFFSISQADVNLEQAREDLTAAGLKTDTLRANLRPHHAFQKASREFAKKFQPEDGARAELMVRPVGDDADQAYVHLVLERIQATGGQKRRIFYEKVGELIFTKGKRQKGKKGEKDENVGHGVEVRRVGNLPTPLTETEDAWLTDHLEEFEGRYRHLLHHLDTHAVRTFVREYIYNLSGTCVKESGGLYFIKQKHADEISRLAEWVRSVGSEFKTVPLLNLTEQRAMIMEAFEDEIVREVNRLGAEVAKILSSGRQIEERTFDNYAIKVAELREKVGEYNEVLGARADRALIEITTYAKQCQALIERIKMPDTITT